MTNGFVRVAAVSSKVKVADVAENFKYICEAIDTLECKHVDIAVFLNCALPVIPVETSFAALI